MKKMIFATFVCVVVADLAAGGSLKLSRPPKVRSISIALSPTSATLTAGASMLFTAQVKGSSSAVSWQATCGTIDSRGRYTAPATNARCDVRATVSTVTSSPAVVTVDAPVPPPSEPPPPGETVIPVQPLPGIFEAALAQAVTAAQSGPVTMVLAPGDYRGNFVLPRTGSSYRITITADPSQLPPAGTRMTPAYEGYLPRLVPAYEFVTPLVVNGDNYTLRGLQVVTPGVGFTTVDVMADGTGAFPRNVTFDQMLIRGNETTGGHRGIAANGINVTITNSWIDRMWEVGRDSQGVAAWDTPGPLTVINNYLEASGENFLLGGSPPSCACVPSDVVFSRNTVRKDPAWRSMSTQPQVKNLFEIKTGRRITATGNTFRYNWMNAQTGWAILFTPQVDSGDAPVAEDIVFNGNIIRDVSSGLSAAAVAGPLRRITVRDNVWMNLDLNTWDGDGRWALIQGGTYGADDITLVNNTVIGLTGNQFLGLYSDVPMQRLTLTHNVVEQREYGVHSIAGLAADALAAVAPGSVFVDNAVIGPDLNLKWPVGNFRIDFNVADQFDSQYAIKPGSPLAGLLTSDGAAVGADPSVLPH